MANTEHRRRRNQVSDADKVAAASRRYYQALQGQVKAIDSGSQDEMEVASVEVTEARNALDGMVSSHRELAGAAIGAALGGAAGALVSPVAAAVGGAGGALVGGVMSSPRTGGKKSNPEVSKLKAKLLR